MFTLPSLSSPSSLPPLPPSAPFYAALAVGASSRPLLSSLPALTRATDTSEEEEENELVVVEEEEVEGG